MWFVFSISIPPPSSEVRSGTLAALSDKCTEAYKRNDKRRFRIYCPPLLAFLYGRRCIVNPHETPLILRRRCQLYIALHFTSQRRLQKERRPFRFQRNKRRYASLLAAYRRSFVSRPVYRHACSNRTATKDKIKFGRHRYSCARASSWFLP